MRRWLVDASNVVGSRPDGWWRDRPGALVRLLDEIARWREETGDGVTVVADGFPTPFVPEGAFRGIDVRYARSNRRDAADDVLSDLVAASAAPGELVVVTSDGALRQDVSTAGAQVEGARRFLDRIADIQARREDRAVLATFGIDESALLGRGGEARVFALDDRRVLRLPHRGYPREALEERRRLLDSIAGPSAPVATPVVLDHVDVQGRTVVVERRLPGRSAMQVLAAPRADRAALVRDHLDVARRVPELPCPTDRFGELWGEHAIHRARFGDWSRARIAASLRAGGDAFGHVDAERITGELLAALDVPEAGAPKLVHLDVFLGNMLASGSRITALLDFGPMTIGGPPDLDALVAIAYLAPEITPTANDDDRAVARRWAADHGLEGAVDPVERWIAAYWTGAPDDERLRAWCRRILR